MSHSKYVLNVCFFCPAVHDPSRTGPWPTFGSQPTSWKPLYRILNYRNLSSGPVSVFIFLTNSLSKVFFPTICLISVSVVVLREIRDTILRYLLLSTGQCQISHGVLLRERHTLWWAVLGCCSEDPTDGLFCCWQRIKPLRSKGLILTHALNMKPLDSAQSETHVARLEYKCSERVLADKEHLADSPRLLEAFPGDWLIVLNAFDDCEHRPC